jgi:hypothetical protein
VDRTEVTFHNQNYTYVLFNYYENDINPRSKKPEFVSPSIIATGQKRN